MIIISNILSYIGNILQPNTKINTSSSHIMNIAIMSGVEENIAKELTSYEQIDALEKGATLEEVLFKDGIPFLAKKAGVPEIDSQLFDYRVQVKAFEQGCSVVESLQFSNFNQLSAFRAGVIFEDSLLFSDYT